MRKLKRVGAAFLNDTDRELMKDFLKHTRQYMRHYELFDFTKSFYDRRQKEIKDRELYCETLDLSKVNEAQMEEAGVSRKDLE